ncbi:MAG: exopolysaccharide biosynthesis protein [Rubricella sp.]
MPPEQHELSRVVQRLRRSTGDAEHVTLATLFDAMDREGQGLPLLICSGFMILPTGLIPGAPALMATFLMLTAFRMLTGRKSTRLPGWLARRRLTTEDLGRAFDLAERAALRLDPLVRARWGRSLLGPHMVALMALATLGLALPMLVIGFIPGVPALLSIPILLFGIGLTSRDGLPAALGLALLAPVVALVVWLARAL